MKATIRHCILLSAMLLVGCSALPSMKYCEHVEYVRDGNKIKLTAECMAPVGGAVSLPGV